ncbi:MAG TPA: hypothetical protein VMI31_07970, partial [Fimbriimonadaceae bacterium]|nr:hypothetical protein [Fimbriimonadaceae bacterium]
MGETGPWKNGCEIPGYRPAFVSNALAGVAPKNVTIRDDGVRQYRTISSCYVLKEPFAKAARSILTDMTPELPMDGMTDEMLTRRASLNAYKLLPDRLVAASVQAGRPVILKKGGVTSAEFGDMESYTLVTLSERPLYVGPAPKSWPAAARHSARLPKAFSGVPGAGLAKEPSFWSRGLTQGGGTQYWLGWYVHQDAKTYFPSLVERLKKSGAWEVSSSSPLNIRCASVKENGFVWLDLDQRRVGSP